MAQQLHVNLAFSADTAKAKSQINELMNSLNQISQPKSQIFDDRELREAANAAKELQYHLSQAVNVNTGKLDLNKFSLSLSQSKHSLTDLYNSLSKAGPQGQQAFLQLASGIAKSDSQVLNLNSKIKELGITLKNTIKWQLSSSLVHGFMGAVQSAIGYTRELNSSLNDIRIVTGYSADQMALFADQANKAAKSLSTTTNNYAKASLIYFQQGLSDEEVNKRTDITVKMANVANSNAELVSEQMTAVWNNFNDGSQSLEYYADVMTALGAATATSTDEISQGLSKFAAVAETVGLSYEYATAALATITSNTRESADVVGNSLKTLFARIQGLQLGETLDDGTDLNKYSQALEKVGISIYDSNGELKTMDNTLDEMAAKWETLTSTQQVALAQTVAGVRQYTQLIALMENWDSGDSDSMMSNLQTAYGAEGALQEQFDIYEEGWEAASNRVEASIERIYQALLDDKAIVSLMNGLEGILNLTGSILEGFGGMQGVLLLISGIVTRNITKEVPGAIEKLKSNFKIITGIAQKEKVSQVQSASNLLNKEMQTGNLSAGQLTRYQATKEELDSMIALEQIRHRLTDAEYESRKSKIAEKKSIQELVASKQDELDVLQKEYELKQKDQQKKASKTTNAQMAASAREKLDALKEDEAVAKQQISNLEKQISRLQEKASKKSSNGKDGLTLNDSNNLATYRAQLSQLKQEQEARLEEIRLSEERHKKLSEISRANQSEGRDDSYDSEIARKSDQLKQLYELKAKQDLVREDFNKQINNWTLSGAGISLLDADSQTKEIEKLRTAIRNYGQELSTIDPDNLNISDLNNEIDKAGDNINELIAAFKRWAQGSSEVQQLTGEIQDAENAVTDLENKIEEVENDLKTLDPSGFDKIQQEAQDAGERIGNLSHQINKLQNEADQQDVNLKVDTMGFSQALTTVGSLGLNLSALFTEVGAAISVCFDEGATSAEKFTAVLSMVPAALMTLGEVIQGLAALPEAMTALKKGFSIFTSGELIGKITSLGTTIGGFFAGISGKAIAATAGIKGLGAIFTGLSATLGPVGAGIAIVAAALAALLALFKAGQAIYNAWAANDPGKQFEAAQQATEGMATAAKDATAAYQELLNTISGYDSAISALEGLEVGTQEFTNALITANEKAWELIDAYGLIQGQDWDYGKDGEIIINDSAKNRITKEANDIREDAVIAHSAAQIQEKEAAYNVSRSNAGMVGYDIQQGYLDQNVLYDALGLTNGSFKHTKDAIQQWQEEGIFNADVADKIAQSLYGADWLDLDSSQLEYINNNIFKYLDEIEAMFGDFSQYNLAKENQFDKQVSTVMSDEEAYQKTSWKGAVNDYLESSFENAKQEALAEYEDDTDDQINAAYEDYLKKTYIEEDGKYYRKDASGNKTGEAVEGLTGLSPEAQKNILATVDAWQVLEDKGVEMAQSFNGIASDMTDSEKDVANALLNGDFNSLTEEQIEAFKSGELSLEEAIGSSNYQQLATLLGEDYIQQLENGFKEAINNWQPPEFDLESWKSDYNIIKDLKIGDTIDPEKWNQLDANMQQFFRETIEGEYALIAAADTLTDKLKKNLSGEIQSQQDQIELGQQAGGKYLSDIGESALSNGVVEGSYNQQRVEAQLNFLKSQNKDTSIYEDKLFDENGDFKTVKAEDIGVFDDLAAAAATAKAEFDALNGSLTENQTALAQSAGTIDELDAMLGSGQITKSIYDNQVAATAMAEAQAEGLDVKAVYQYAEGIEHLIESEEDAEMIAQKIAVANKKMEKGMDNLTTNWKKWSKAIKKGDKESTAYIEAMGGIKDSISDILDLDVDALSESFYSSAETLSLLEKAAKGDKQAILDLRKAAAEDIVQQITIDGSQLETDALAKVSELASKLPDLKLGASLDSTGLTDGLNEMLESTDMSVAEMQRILDALGFNPEIEYKEVPVDQVTFSQQTGTAEVINPITGEVTTVTAENVGQFAESGMVKIPTINGSKTTYRGNGGGSSPKNSGGGGGGQKKHAEKKNDSDKERYHTITNQLEDLKDEYEEISEAADRAFGQDKLDAIDDQIDKTDELIDKQEEYLDAISENLPKDKAIMDAYYNKVIGGPKIEYDERGNIANFDEIQDAMFAKYNKMAGSLTEDSESWQQFEKQYGQLEKYIKQYEETYDLLREEEAEYQELLNQRLDLQLEKVEYGVELNLNINEDDLAILEFQLDLLEDKAFESANRIALSTKQASNLYDQILINQKGLEDALGLSLSPGEIAEMMQGDMSVLEGKTFTEAQIDAIKDYRDNLLDLNSELVDIQKQVEEEVLTAFDEWHEELDRGIEKFDHYGNILENYKNIIDIVGKDALGLDNENIAKLSEAQVNNSINRLKANKDAYESYQKSAEEAENKMKKAQEDATAARLAGNEELAKSYDEDAEFWKETAQEMNDSAQEAQEELMDNWGNTLEVIVSQFEEAVERAIEAFNDAIYELGGLEGLSADFGRAKEDDDTYLDDYQKIYELSKLTRDINNKIDDTDIIAGKQKLKALLEDINELQEDGVEMSQYDLEYLQATYDLRLAELELEEARNAKNTVRLQKDNEGNWSYVYTQNTDAVDSAQQKYEDALYAMQDLSTNYIDEMSEKLISTSQEMQEALAAVRVEDYASIEEYYAELDRIERLYTERMSKQQVELQKGLDNNKTLYNTDWLNYSEATGYKISKAEEFAQAFSNTMLGQLTNTDTVDAFGQLITSATTTLVSGLTTAATTYYQNIGLATEAAGSSITDFADLLEEDIEAIKSKSGEAASSVEDMATRMDTAMTDIIDKVAGWQEEYGKEIDKIINKNLRVIETYNNMIKALSGASGKITISYDVDSTTSTPVDVGTAVPEGTAQAATGGYTGNWGSNEGKLAILHQRELILNELDTSNFLQALEITRQIMSVIDIQAKQASLGLGAITASTLKDEKPKETLEQEVHITAEFPNVNNHYEIEEAFNTLINTASQYANRK